MKKVLVFCLISCMLFSLCACNSKENSFESNLKDAVTNETTDITEDGVITEIEESTDLSYSTEILEDLKDKYIAEITVENYGVITLELDSTVAPITVSNFVTLVKEGFYNGLTFHRIMEGFMMQGGCPEGTGYGGSDTSIKGEFSNNGVENTLSHTRGVVSMARSNETNSASSQFFIVHSDATYLDGAYAAFGKVIKGMEIVDSICSDAEPVDDNGTILAENQPVITSIVIVED